MEVQTINESQTLKIIMKNGGVLFLYDVKKFRLLRDEDFWIVEKSNGNHVFISADEVMVIGFDKDLK